jgi:hypothetical protein
MADSSPRELVELLAVARAYQQSRALAVAAELGVADLLSDGSCSVEELASATRTNGPALYRLLRALASIGVFHEDDQRRFSLTAMGDYLRTDHPLTLAPVTRMFCADYEWQAWGELLHSVRTGENAAVHALGVDIWEYRRRHPEAGEVFDAAMRTLSRATTGDLLGAYNFGRHQIIADIGGGTGAVLASVLVAHPALRGILFDRPHVVANAGPVLQDAGVADRVTVVAGDFFEAVPDGADAYVLRRILHDWAEEKAVQILRRIHEVMEPDARLLVLDAVVGPPDDDPLTKFLDLMMLVSAGGRERTEPEWKALLADAGFRVECATRATSNMHVIEAVRV